jgi:enamine deaminase RidA (YjgF/YER057c/UK114 family)
MEIFTWTSFGVSIFQTAIGSGLGFVLGLVAFHYQQKREKQAEAKEAKDDALDALTRVLQTAGLNIEALAVIKLQIINDLKPEVEEMKGFVETYFDGDQAGRGKCFHEMKAASEEMRSFYKTFTPLPIMPAPDFREFSLVTHDMPALTTFLHRAMSTMHEINEQLRERNALISGHARDGAEGMTAERFVYYASMISGIGDYLCQSIDNDLEYFCLTMEQVEGYMEAKNNGKHLKFVIAEKAKDELPKSELFPELRKQMAKFGEHG